MSDAFKPLLARLASGAVLRDDEAEAFFLACLRAEPTPAQVAAALTALHLRGETIEEITSGAKALRQSCDRFDYGEPLLDNCGTGGDGAHTYNISTAASLIVAGCGVKVAKHGTRAFSSKSGSSDVLAALGVNIDLDNARAKRCLDEANIAFLFALKRHSAMRHVAPIRAELGFRTIFNLLGPLSNPAFAQYQMLGVFEKKWTAPLAEVLRRLGLIKAMVVHGGDGLDEITLTGPTFISETTAEGVIDYELDPRAFGLKLCQSEDLRGGTPQDNAAAVLALLGGKPGPYRDIAALNAAAALYVRGAAKDIAAGLELAMDALDSGAAKRALETLIRVSND